MWPVHELEERLGNSFRVCEDEDFVVVRCRRCGWTAWFSATTARESIVAEAARHRCPETAPARPERTP